MRERLGASKMATESGGMGALRSRLADQRRQCDQGVGRLELLNEKKQLIREQLERAVADLALWREAHELLTRSSDVARERIRGVIEQTVTAALRSIVSSDLTFRVDVGDRGGHPTVDWLVASRYGSGAIETPPEDARGGGIVDIVSLALRMAVLELVKPAVEGLLILDEPGKMLSEEYVPALAGFLLDYAQSTGRQVLMVTHNEALVEVAGRGYRVTMADGTSQVEEL